MLKEMEYDLINGEALEEASQDYMRLRINEVTPLEKLPGVYWT